MKSVKNLTSLQNQVASKNFNFNQKNIVGGVYALILSAQPEEPEEVRSLNRLSSGSRINS